MVPQADHRDGPVVAGSDRAKLARRLPLARGGRQRETVLPTDQLGHHRLDERLEGVVAHGPQHRGDVGPIRADVTLCEGSGRVCDRVAREWVA